MNILIAGGNSDIAKYFQKSKLKNFKIFCATKKEMDVTSSKSIDMYLSKLPPIDWFINTAGSIHQSSLIESDESLWLNDINVNFVSNYLISKKLLIKDSKTKMIFISSMSAFNYYKNWSSYCISKMATVNLVKHLAIEGHDAFCICPGGIDTKFRNKINIDNPNLLTVKDIYALLCDIIFENAYRSGDCIMYKKNYFKVESLYKEDLNGNNFFNT